LNSLAPNLASNRLTALDTVAFDNRNSAAARAKDCICRTFAKIARPSKSGSFDMAQSETMSFDRFYL
jgi:hypothetical protein